MNKTDCINKHVFGSDFIHNVNTLVKEFKVLTALKNYMELNSEVILNNLELNDLKPIVDDISKGTYVNGNRKLDMSFEGISVNDNYVYDLVDVFGETLGTYELRSNNIHEFSLELESNLNELFPDEVDVMVISECNNGKTTFIRIVDKESKNFSSLSEINFRSLNKPTKYFNWFKTTSSLAHMLFSIEYYVGVIEGTEKFHNNIEYLEYFLDFLKDYEELSKKWAVNPEDEEVADGEYSSKHYSIKSKEMLEEVKGIINTGRFVVTWHPQVIDENMHVPDDMNAFSAGPLIEIAEGTTVTIGKNSYWNVIAKRSDSE